MKLWKISSRMPPLARWKAYKLAGRIPPVRIFQIGFNKAGTTAIYRFLNDAGIPTVHFDGGRLARRLTDRIKAGQEPLLDYPLTVGFTDLEYVTAESMIEPFRKYDVLEARYPESLFILNTRDEDGWVASRRRHFSNNGNCENLIDRHMAYYHLSENDVVELWRADRLAHHAHVRSHFAGSSRFLELPIDEKAGERLRSFLLPFFPSIAHASWGRHNTLEARVAVRQGAEAVDVLPRRDGAR